MAIYCCFYVLLQNRERVSSFLMWAISTALKEDSAQMLQHKESHPCFTISSEEEIYEESLISKLLRWLTAAVILGKISDKTNYADPGFSTQLKLGTLQSLLDLSWYARDKSFQNIFCCADLLAAVIFHLQQHLGINCRVLPSVISALCLLFDASNFAGKMLLLIVGLVVWHAGLGAGVLEFGYVHLGKFSFCVQRGVWNGVRSGVLFLAEHIFYPLYELASILRCEGKI